LPTPRIGVDTDVGAARIRDDRDYPTKEGAMKANKKTVALLAGFSALGGLVFWRRHRHHKDTPV
jgi:hypothetical protein